MQRFLLATSLGQLSINLMASVVYGIATVLLWPYVGEMPIVLLGTHAAVGVVVFFAIKLTLVRTRRGRENAMQYNVELISEETPRLASGDVVCSTRFARWPLSESSPARVAFRNQITQLVKQNKYGVRRLWNVNCKDDAKRMLELVEEYKGNSSLTMKAFFDVPDNVLVEVLVVGTRVASLSLAQANNPTGMESCVAVRDKETIGIVQRYFDAMWNSAEPVLVDGVPQPGALSKLTALAV